MPRKGVIEPLIVRSRGDRFQIIAGERRYQAAVQVGLRELPVVIRDVDDAEVIELALVENIQRKDLTAFEEAEALHQLAQRSSYTHEALARKLGKSRTSITESLALNAMPEEIKNLCRLADISSKSLLLQIVRQPTPQKMTALVEKIASQGGATRAEVRQDLAKPKAGPTEGVRLQLQTGEQSVQPEAEVPQGQRPAPGSHRSARSHPRKNSGTSSRVAQSHGEVGQSESRESLRGMSSGTQRRVS